MTSIPGMDLCAVGLHAWSPVPGVGPDNFDNGIAEAGSRTKFAYDPRRRLIEKLFADGTSFEWAYDARGNRTLQVAPAITRSHSFDALNRVSSVVDERFPKTLAYTYDASGNRASMEVVEDGELTAYEWDARGLILRMVDPDGGEFHFVYDAAGRRTGLSYPNGILANYSTTAPRGSLPSSTADSTGP